MQQVSPEELKQLEDKGVDPAQIAEDMMHDDSISDEVIAELEGSAIIGVTNVASSLKEEVLNEMSNKLIEMYDSDKESRSMWEKKNNDYLRLATQVAETKTWPWENSANVKYPLLTTASIQFASRAYNSLTPADKQVVRGKVVGKDDTLETKRKRANRVARHMSYQLFEEMVDWDDDMDKLCLILPICGNVFKKTYYDGKANRSDLILPQDLVTNYYATSIEDARLKTHVLQMYPNEVHSKMMRGEFLKADLQKPQMSSEIDREVSDELHGVQEPTHNSNNTPYEILECHCWWDIDQDGYEEPYIITIEKESKKVLRIVARYDIDGVETTEDGQIVEITPIEYFTNFIFVPAPQSGVYAIGFGSLLGPLNEATNTIINQLIDSGTLNNLQSGFLARGVRVTNGEKPLKPGEWRYVNTPGDDLRKGIVPLPTKEPSGVLFSLLGMLVDSGQQVASVTNLMMGESPGQNQPYSTTAAMLEQGLKVFSSIYKRIHRSLKKECKKLYRLNKLYLDPEVYFSIIDPQNGEDQNFDVSITDYRKDDTDIIPSADPNVVSDLQKLAKAEALLQLIPLGTVNPQEATKRSLEAQGHEDIDLLLALPEPQMDFDQQLERDRLEFEKVRASSQDEMLKMKTMYQASRDEAAATKTYAEASALEARQKLDEFKAMHDASMAEAKNEIDGFKAKLDEFSAVMSAKESKEKDNTQS